MSLIISSSLSRTRFGDSGAATEPPTAVHANVAIPNLNQGPDTFSTDKVKKLATKQAENQRWKRIADVFGLKRLTSEQKIIAQRMLDSTATNTDEIE